MPSTPTSDPGSRISPPGANQRQPFSSYRFGTSFVSKNGHAKRPAALTVADVIDWYLAQAVTELAESTFRSEKTVQLAFAKDLGHLRISEAKPFHLKDWVVARKTWKSPATRQSGTARIRSAFGCAAKLGKIDRDPFKGVAFPANCYRRAITTDEHNRAVAACVDPNFADMLQFLWLTGVRTDELVSLEWAWVHHEFISMPEHKSQRRTGEPRDVVITDAISAILDRAKARRPDSKLVFTTQNGTPWKVSNTLRQKWERIRWKARLPEDVTLYCYRHSVATRMIAAGVPDITVAKCLGHSDVRMLKRYAHPRIKDLRAAFETAANTTL